MTGEKSLRVAGYIANAALIIVPFIFAPGIPITTAQIAEDDVIIWKGTYDLERDGFLTEKIKMEIPVLRESVSVDVVTTFLQLHHDF